MLSDRDLTVTDAFGLRNLGFHSGPLGLEGLPVPTSILIGSDGKVLWVDQAENYQRRRPGGRADGLAALPLTRLGSRGQRVNGGACQTVSPPPATSRPEAQ